MEIMPIINLTDKTNSTTIETSLGTPLSQAIWLCGKLAPLSLCAGLGLCGKCRCKFLTNAPLPSEADKQFFSSQELDEGWRLACRHKVDFTKANIELPKDSFKLLHPSPTALKSASDNFAIMGIDVGTTSIQWQCMDQTHQKKLSGSQLNPQGAAGADIISRIQYTLEHPGKLSNLTLNAISSFLRLAEENNLTINKMCIAANTAQTEILLKKNIQGLAQAPYSLSFKGNEWLDMEFPFIPGKIPTYFPPLLAPFVGGDISAGLAALIDKPTPFLLIDLGTNAELALYNEHKLTVVSAPLGPALEGIGPRNGQLAAEGVITGFKLSPFGLEAQFYKDKPVEKPTGISATGYLSLISHLLKLGILSKSSQYLTTNPMPLAKKITARISNNELLLNNDLKLTLNDLELLLKVKATFRVAFDRLIEVSHIIPSTLEAIYIAGAISEYISPEDLCNIGFFPDSIENLIHFAGNTSLEGALLLAQDNELIKRLGEICSYAHCIQLAQEQDFMERYLSAMHWGNDEKF